MTYEKTSIRTRPLETTPVAGLGGISLFDLYHRYSLPESLILDKERKPMIRHKGDSVHRNGQLDVVRVTGGGRWTALTKP